MELGETSNTTALGDQVDDHLDYFVCLAGESQAMEKADLDNIDYSLLCNEKITSSAINNVASTSLANNVTSTRAMNNIASCGISDLENLEFDTPPDFPLPVSIHSSIHQCQSTIITYKTM